MRAGRWWIVVPLLGAGCVEFDAAEERFCQRRPDVCATDGAAGGGTGDGGLDGDSDGGFDGGTCGDGVRTPEEVCDDGNDTFGDGCDPTCRFVDSFERFSGHPQSQSYADSEVPEGARFYSVSGLTTDGVTVWAADWGNHAVRAVTLDGKVGTPWGGPAVFRALDGGSGSLLGPVDVHYQLRRDGGVGFLYVADAPFPTSGAGRVFRVDLGPGVVSRDLRAYHPGPITDLVAVTGGVDFHGNERVVTLAAVGLQQWRVTAGGGAGSDTPLALRAELDAVSGSAEACSDVEYGGATRTSDGGLLPRYFVGCSSSIVEISNGSLSVLAGLAGTTGCADGPSGTARVGVASGLAFEGASLAFVDASCGVRRVDLTTRAVTTIAGLAGEGVEDGPNDKAKFRSPQAIARAATGELLVSDEGFRLRRVTAAATSTLAGPAPSSGQLVFGPDAGYTAVGGLAVDDTHVYAVVPYLHLLFRVSLETGASEALGTITTVDPGRFPGPVAKVGDQLFIAYANGAVRQVDLTRLKTDGGLDVGFVQVALAEAFTSLATDGTQLFAVTGRNQIAAVALDGGIELLAGSPGGTAVVDGVGTAASFARPRALTSSQGQLYVVDGPMGLRGNGTVVRRLSLADRRVTTLVGRLAETGADDELVPDAGTALFAGAASLATDGRSLFIGDVGDGAFAGDPSGGTLRVYDLKTHRLGTALGRAGQYSFLPGRGRAARLNGPAPMVYDSAHRRVLVFDSAESAFGAYR